MSAPEVNNWTYKKNQNKNFFFCFVWLHNWIRNHCLSQSINLCTAFQWVWCVWKPYQSHNFILRKHKKPKAKTEREQKAFQLSFLFFVCVCAVRILLRLIGKAVWFLRWLKIAFSVPYFIWDKQIELNLRVFHFEEPFVSDTTINKIASNFRITSNRTRWWYTLSWMQRNIN